MPKAKKKTVDPDDALRLVTCDECGFRFEFIRKNAAGHDECPVCRVRELESGQKVEASVPAAHAARAVRVVPGGSTAERDQARAELRRTREDYAVAQSMERQIAVTIAQCRNGRGNLSEMQQVFHRIAQMMGGGVHQWNVREQVDMHGVMPMVTVELDMRIMLPRTPAQQRIPTQPDRFEPFVPSQQADASVMERLRQQFREAEERVRREQLGPDQTEHTIRLAQELRALESGGLLMSLPPARICICAHSEGAHGIAATSGRRFCRQCDCTGFDEGENETP